MQRLKLALGLQQLGLGLLQLDLLLGDLVRLARDPGALQIRQTLLHLLLLLGNLLLLLLEEPGICAMGLDVAQGLLQARHLLRVIVRPGEAQLLGHCLMPGLAADVFTAIGLSGQQQ